MNILLTSSLLAAVAGGMPLGSPALGSDGTDERPSLTQHVHDAWRPRDGLIQRSVHAITGDTQGYLWLATEDGLVRFDGGRFVTFNTRSTPGFRHDYVQAIVAGPDGVLWVGTWNGLMRLSPGASLQAFTARHGLASDAVSALSWGPSGTLWIGTRQGLSTMREGKFSSIPGGPASTFVVRAVVEHGDGSVWVGTDGSGLLRLVGGRLVPFPAVPGSTILTMLADRDGSLWLGSEVGLTHLTGSAVNHQARTIKLSCGRVTSLLQSQAGDLWIGTTCGLNRLREGRMSSFRARDGLTDDAVLALWEDGEESLWIGTKAGGLNRLRVGPFRTFDAREGLTSDRVWAVLQAEDGGLWVGTRDGGLNHLLGGRATAYTTADGLRSDSVLALARGDQETLWVGTTSGLHYLRDGRVVHENAPTGPGAAYIRSLYRDSAGRLWIGTQGSGAYALKEGSYQRWRTSEGLPSDTVGAFLETADGAMWIGTDRGLARLSSGRLTIYTRKDGMSGQAIRALWQDAAGDLWVGTNDGGLCRLRGGRWIAYRAVHGLFDDRVHGFVEDGRGRFWVSSDRGPFWLAKSELDAFAAGRQRSVTSHSFGYADGLKTAECNSGSPAVIRAADGRIWFATAKGAAVTDPALEATNLIIPQVRVDEMRVDGDLVSLRESVAIPPGWQRLEIYFTTSSLRVPERNRFRYRMGGLDEQWVEGAERKATYTRLPPGEYTFQVRASNDSGLWSPAAAGVTLQILPEWHQTTWFAALVGSAAVLSGIGLHRFRVRRLRARERELGGRVRDSLAKIKVLSGLLPICSGCKKIRDDAGYWTELETYISEHSQAGFSHGLCWDCAHRLYPELADRVKARRSP